MYEDSMVVSDGGRVLTDLSTAAGTTETTKAVYEKQ
jgi:hypothetical protein